MTASLSSLETIAAGLAREVEGAFMPAPVPAAAPAPAVGSQTPAATAFAPADIAKFAAAFIAWFGQQEPTIMAGLSVADTLAKFVAVFVPGAEAVDMGIELAEADIPTIYAVSSAALPYLSTLATVATDAGGAFTPMPPSGTQKRPTGLV